MVAPEFGSSLTSLIIELDYLRKKQFYGSTPRQTFLQLKHIFHILESLGSARIEGNNTTIAEYIETKLAETPLSNPGIREILNIEKAMSFIDDNIEDAVFNRAFVNELHKKVVEGLPLPPNGEGDHAPGLYRTKSVSITMSAHKPPLPIHIERYMDELFAFINRKDE
ncbi:MAG: Fic family protein, partial [Deltaproteobacteria bacterium]|nr:Fic family protein [Deltaproteobacteria bacterium]